MSDTDSGRVMAMKRHYVAALVFSLIYVLLAVQMTSAGHGTVIFLAPLTPLGLPWLLLIAAFVALTYKSNSRAGYVFVSLMAAHYVLTASMFLFMWKETLPGTTKMFRLWPVWIVGTTLAYILPQVYLWASFGRSLREPKKVPNSTLTKDEK